MADVKVADANSGGGNLPSPWGPYWTSETTGYLVIKITGPQPHIAIFKTTDGGATWTGQDTANDPVAQNVMSMAVWMEKETPGDTGTKLLVTYIRRTDDDVRFIAFDTATDTWGTEVQVAATFTVSAAVDASDVGVAKMRGGNIIVAARGDLVGSSGAWKSTDGGSSWSAVADPYDASANDWLRLFPGNEADNQDGWAVYVDDSANEVDFLLYDDSANTWTLTNIATGINNTVGTVKTFFDGAIRHSDHHLLLAIWNDRDVAAADLLTFDINGSGSITAKGNIVTDSDDCYGVALLIDQNDDTVYAAYIGSEDGTQTFFTATQVFYKSSSDGMATWGAQTAYGTDNDDIRAVSAGHSVTSDGGRFMPAWYNDDLLDVLVNVGNDVEIAGGSDPPRSETIISTGTSVAVG